MAKRKLTPEARREALRVIAGNPKCNQPQRENPADKFPFILPPLDIKGHYAIESEAMGITRSRRALAWRIVCGSKEDAFIAAYLRGMDHKIKLWRALEAAIDLERRQTLAILLEQHPNVAKRIMKGLQKKD